MMYKSCFTHTAAISFNSSASLGVNPPSAPITTPIFSSFLDLASFISFLNDSFEASYAKNDLQRGDRRKKKTKITSGYIGYTIAPRINAAGRIKDASIAVELFLSESKDRASALAEELCDINLLRQQEVWGY